MIPLFLNWLNAWSIRITSYYLWQCFRLNRVEFFAYDPSLRKAVINSVKSELAESGGILGLGDVEKGQLRSFVEEAVSGKYHAFSNYFICVLQFC